MSAAASVFEGFDSDSRISVEEMSEVAEDLRALARELHEAELEHVDFPESPWTCYCEGCLEARSRQ